MTLERQKTLFTEIFQRENDPLFRFSFWRVSNREIALELTQETFARLWSEMREGKEVANPKAFLYVVMKRLIIDWYRKHKSLSLDALTSDEDRPFDPRDDRALESLEISPDAKKVLSLIDQLDEKQKEVVYLRFVEDLPPREIAKVLRVSPNAVSIRLSRGLDELRKISGIEKWE